MKQRAKVFIEFPEDMNVAMLKEQLNENNCKVEVQAVLLPLKGFEIPKEFLFEDEKEDYIHKSQDKRGKEK
ncbi:hypothetical protein LCGC14_1399510 [marine sediment metagenome]|uniref:Uncharacterized protein n=1 Tax=marine sediment metagenome TaxID=412755 RepID=A0A0F9KIF1_9ZZZZ